MSQSNTRLERCYAQIESVYGEIPNAGGTASLAGTDAIRFIQGRIYNQVPTIERPDKTGSRGVTAGIPGRRIAAWELAMGLCASGTPGTKPRIDPFLQAIFGQAGQATPGVSVVYDLADTIPSFCLWSFRQPATMAQRVAHGLLVDSAEFILGQDAATWQARGTGQWVLDSDQFAGASAIQKGGLTTFPVEPTPVFSDGGLIIGFTGLATIGGTPAANIREMRIRITTGNQAVRDTFGSFYPTEAEGATRRVSISFSLYDEDTQAMTDLRAASHEKTPLNIVCQVGTVPGSIWTLTVKQVQLASSMLNDSLMRWTNDIGESGANESAPSALDEVSLTLT